MLMIATFFGE